MNFRLQEVISGLCTKETAGLKDSRSFGSVEILLIEFPHCFYSYYVIILFPYLSPQKRRNTELANKYFMQNLHNV
jgi:hypothetical protein